jgi:hypothetical protein
MDTSEVINAIITLFTEAYAGPPNPSSTWFIDNEPDSGILGLIATVSAAEASWSSNHNSPGTSIASHAEHLRWSLANANSALEGKPYQANWSESWTTLEVDQMKWDWLRLSLRTEYEMLIENLQKQKDMSGDFLLGTLALLPHAGYHLGTIRQLIERARMAAKVTQ